MRDGEKRKKLEKTREVEKDERRQARKGEENETSLGNHIKPETNKCNSMYAI